MGVFDRFRKRAQAEMSAALVRDLLRDQAPHFAGLPITFGAHGWDNQLWRLGDELAVRLPWHTEAADELLLKELQWLPVLAPRLPLPVPVPQFLGEPSDRYPHPWIVTTWVPGTPADRDPVTTDTSADALAAFLDSLHAPAPDDLSGGRGRGGPLTSVAGVARWFRKTSELCAAVAPTGTGVVPDAQQVRAVWEDAVTAPAWAEPPAILHGDLHPANVLTNGGELCGVIDFGDLCAGDPALDVAACWILLPDLDSIARFRSECVSAADDATWRRARGWAIWRAFGGLEVATASHAGGKPSWGPPALASLQRLVASASGTR